MKRGKPAGRQQPGMRRGEEGELHVGVVARELRAARIEARARDHIPGVTGLQSWTLRRRRGRMGIGEQAVQVL